MTQALRDCQKLFDKKHKDTKQRQKELLSNQNKWRKEIQRLENQYKALTDKTVEIRKKMYMLRLNCLKFKNDDFQRMNRTMQRMLLRGCDKEISDIKSKRGALRRKIRSLEVRTRFDEFRMNSNYQRFFFPKPRLQRHDRFN